MQFTNRIFLSINSTEDVAAALPAGILYFTLFCFFMVTAGFTSVLVAQYHGAGDAVSCVRSVWSGFYFALIAMMIITFIVPPLGRLILTYGGHPPEIMAREIEYFNSLIPSGAFVCLSCPFFAFFSGRGQTKFVAIVNLIACALNILLDYGLIFGNFGLPALGIGGAGFATVIASIFSSVVVTIAFFMVNQHNYPTRLYRDFEWKYLKKIIIFGIPAGTQAVADVGGWTALTFMLGHLTPESLAATTIALAINNLSFMPLLGFSDATAIVVGQYVGKKRPRIANRGPYHAWLMVSVFMIFSGLVYLIFPISLFKLFSPRDSCGIINFNAVIITGQYILIFAAIFNFFDAAKFIYSGALRGAGDTHAVLYISLFCTWILLVPGTALLIFLMHSSVITVWAYITCCTLIEAIIVFYRFRSGNWRKISLVH
jgi:MATE family multidrug resistance protein